MIVDKYFEEDMLLPEDKKNQLIENYEKFLKVKNEQNKTEQARATQWQKYGVGFSIEGRLQSFHDFLSEQYVQYISDREVFIRSYGTDTTLHSFMFDNVYDYFCNAKVIDFAIDATLNALMAFSCDIGKQYVIDYLSFPEDAMKNNTAENRKKSQRKMRSISANRFMLPSYFSCIHAPKSSQDATEKKCKPKEGQVEICKVSLDFTKKIYKSQNGDAWHKTCQQFKDHIEIVGVDAFFHYTTPLYFEHLADSWNDTKGTLNQYVSYKQFQDLFAIKGINFPGYYLAEKNSGMATVLTLCKLAQKLKYDGFATANDSKTLYGSFGYQLLRAENRFSLCHKLIEAKDFIVDHGLQAKQWDVLLYNIVDNYLRNQDIFSCYFDDLITLIWHYSQDYSSIRTGLESYLKEKYSGHFKALFDYNSDTNSSVFFKKYAKIILSLIYVDFFQLDIRDYEK